MSRLLAKMSSKSDPISIYVSIALAGGNGQIILKGGRPDFLAVDWFHAIVARRRFFKVFMSAVLRMSSFSSQPRLA